MQSVRFFQRLPVLRNGYNLQLYSTTIFTPALKSLNESHLHYRLYHKDDNNTNKSKQNTSFETNQFHSKQIPVNIETNQKLPDLPFKKVTRSLAISEVLANTIDNLVSFIEKLTHMDELRKAQNEVMKYKDQLQEFSDYKRKIMRDLGIIRKEMLEIHMDMRLANRGSDHHIQLLNCELECLQKEKIKQNEFQSADEEEREAFNRLTNAISDSYAKEKVHTQSVRIWGYIQTIVACIFTFFMTISTHYHQEYKIGLLADRLEKNVNNTIKSEIGKLIEDTQLSLKEMEERMLNKIDNKQESWGSYIKRHGTSVYRFFWRWN